MLEHEVWNRKGEVSHEMSQLGYVGCIIITFALAVAVFFSSANAIAGYIGANGLNWFAAIACLIIGFVGMLVSSAVFTNSKSPVVSGLGVTGLAFFSGVMFAPVFSITDPNIIGLATVITTGLFATLSFVSILASLFGRLDTDSWGPMLMQVLIVLIVAQFAGIILAAFGLALPVFNGIWQTVIAWVSIVLFSLFIIYDWNQALKLDRTYDNAIDAAGALMMDWLNILISVIRLLSNTND
jgi:uncharacterized protein